MGNSAGKENDINNLMHITIVKDADLPKTEVEQNNASGESISRPPLSLYLTAPFPGKNKHLFPGLIL